MPTVRMHTRCIAVVHSHVIGDVDHGVIDLSNDVIAVQTNKSLKGSGGASLTIVPRRNYLNLIFPNDIINIYFDPGDGKRGFVRTFFGYVDRIERSVSTDANGATSTMIRLSCTDVTKVFDRTEIYFNPSLDSRTDLAGGQLGADNIGGAALRTSGITANGTPADMIENLAEMLLGFGAQWVLPESYKNFSWAIDKTKKIRQARAQAKVPAADLAKLTSLGANIDNLSAQLDTTTQKINAAIANSSLTTASALRDLQVKKDQLEELITNSELLNAASKISDSQNGSFQFTVLDLLDLSFIEAASIDGFISDKAVWDKSGSLASVMYGYSNEEINELFFDLRPAMVDGGGGLSDTCFGTTYSTEPDELSINVAGLGDMKSSVAATRYTPAIVMREYPYSTSEGVDLSHTFITDLGGEYGFVAFGPVFGLNVNPTEPVRAIYDYSNASNSTVRGGINPINPTFTEVSKPLKHLDIIPITSQDVKDESIGRSDNDIYNFLAAYASDEGATYKFLMKDLLPICTPVSIERNGLRVKEYTSIFANWSGIDNQSIRRNMARWSFLLDHWNQHNNEYLNGEMTLRGMPEIRVGYRLDYVDRHESYYVEEVGHSWQYPDTMTTRVVVSRGQRNDPMPAYIPPAVSKNFGVPLTSQDILTNIVAGGASSTFKAPGTHTTTIADVESVSSDLSNGGGNRTDTGRLGVYFHVNPTYATIQSTGNTPQDRLVESQNVVDTTADLQDFGGTFEAAVQTQPAANISTFVPTDDEILNGILKTQGLPPVTG